MAALLKIAENVGIRMAKGDAIISFLSSVATGETTPGREFIDKYPEQVVHWICKI
jgi:hypothetical protein